MLQSTFVRGIAFENGNQIYVKYCIGQIKVGRKKINFVQVGYCSYYDEAALLVTTSSTCQICLTTGKCQLFSYYGPLSA